MIRAILGVVIGFVIWSLIWVAGNKLFFAEAENTVREGKVFDQTMPLAGAIVLSVLASLVAGASCKFVARKQSRVPEIILAVALLATGIAVQASIWKLEPLWYHLAFLALLVPVTLVGASLLKAKGGKSGQ